MSREKVFCRVRDIVGKRTKGVTEGLCLYWAHYGLAVLKHQGITACLQAGSAYWLRVPDPSKEPGDAPTHFGYKWTPDSEDSQDSMRLGNLPEMHVWLGITGTQEIVDFSAGTWPDACRARGLEWTAPEPPDFFWGTESACTAHDCYYIPMLEATIAAAHFCERLEEMEAVR